MFYEEVEPEKGLLKVIKCFWKLEHDYREEFHCKEHLWARTNCELIFAFGHPYYLKTESGKEILPQNFVMGPFKKNLTLWSDGFTGFVAVRFQDWGVFPFSLKPISTLVDSILPAEEVFGHHVKELSDLMEKTESLEKFQMLKEYFQAELAEKHNTNISSIPIVSKIIEEKGVITISRILREFDISPRQLQRIFKTEIGLSAKTFSRIIRFNQARKLIEKNPDISLSELTYEIGYSDQSHFANNFRELFDISPANFQDRVKQIRRHFEKGENNVVFLQDD